MNRKNVAWVGSLLAAVVSLALAGCDSAPPETVLPAPQVSVKTLIAQDVTLHEDLPGRVAAVRTAEIRPQVGGIIQRRLFEQGAEIRAGQPLFQINPAPFKADADMAAAALQRAEAALARARVQATRLKPLVETDAVSRQTYDDAVSQRDQAAADVAQARATLARRQLDLKFATVDAPIGGRIDQALVTEGTLVGPNDSNPMARIQQIDQVYVDVRQPAAAMEALREALAPQASEGQFHNEGLPVTILRSNGQPYPETGRILFSGINVDVGTGDVLLRILVDNPERRLLPGMFVQAKVPRGHYDNAILLSQQAVSHAGGKAQVWVVDEQHHVHLTSVVLGELVNGAYRIRSGLSEGQRVVIAGGERLTDGVKVSAQPWVQPEVGGAKSVEQAGG
ncbi:efflux RND transporter periplasmic adaptor subunit [Pusillimonas caeni]|uniref:efflux RND transporter periplasmic adaptor subunit n=1 Tax=Pusillimonas caeni TaxID=1348472 RepID=UPI000E59A5AC|nr:efflux RND transporter periplasmic adaptor subunit [Pusillimonas caeni]TFL15322.1 efflux RND transporter periplasmic adaptor subunit [Pusillimonas caeni]